MQKVFHSLVLALLVSILGIEIFLFASRILIWEEAVMPLVLAGAGVMALFFRSDRSVSMVLASFLVAFSTALSGLSWGELRILIPGASGRIADFLWTGMLCAMPFLFVHLALIFPVRSQFWAVRSWLVLLHYATPLLLAVAGQFDELIWLVEPLVFLFPLGLLTGIGIFARQYRYHLTEAEKQRLRLVLIGSIAGIIPRLIFLLARESLPAGANRFSLMLLPLFPLGLLLASQPLSLGELDPRLRRFFGWGVSLAVWIATSFFVLVLVVFLFPGLSLDLALLVAATGGMILVFPVGRLAVSYLTEERFWSPARQATPVDFSPIRPNPFIVGNPVRDPNMFFGRRAEFQFVQQTLRAQKGGCVIVLCGERRTGKTSILWQIREGRLGDSFRPIFLDMQGIVARSDEEFLDWVQRECERSLEGLMAESSGLTVNPEREDLGDLLHKVTTRHSGMRLLLLIDEYELIEDRIQAGRLSFELPRYLNSLLERIPGLSYVLAGSHPLTGKMLWNDFLGKSFYREISFLDLADAEALLRDPLAGRVVLEERSLAKLLRLSAGHPYFTQLLGQNLVDLVNERGQARVDLQEVNWILTRILEHPPPHLLYLWGERSLEEKLVLAALASLISSSVQFIPWGRIHRVLASVADDRARTIDGTRTRIVLERLRRLRLLDRDQERYRFKMDLLRAWVETEQSIWSVLSG